MLAFIHASLSVQMISCWSFLQKYCKLNNPGLFHPLPKCLHGCLYCTVSSPCLDPSSMLSTQAARAQHTNTTRYWTYKFNSNPRETNCTIAGLINKVNAAVAPPVTALCEQQLLHEGMWNLRLKWATLLKCRYTMGVFLDQLMGRRLSDLHGLM